MNTVEILIAGASFICYNDLDYMGFVLDLEDAFGCHVDVVTDGINDLDFLQGIRRDEVLLYEEA